MKKIFFSLSILCLGLSMQAQSGVVRTREANDVSGKILTMEETILSRELSPVNIGARWTDDGKLIMAKDGKWQVMNIEDESFNEYKPVKEYPEAYTEGQSLYLRTEDGNTVPVAVSENDQITYGQFVSRNEFSISNGIFWAPDKSKLAFYRKDESRVTTFPLLDITTRTGSLREIKYPMAGMDSENVQLGVYDLESGTTIYLKAEEFGYDRYLTNISWTPDASGILVQVLDRSQKNLKLNLYDSSTGELVKTILTEHNDKYVEPQDPVWFVKGSDDIFIYRTDNRDGFRNLYLCDFEGNVSRLTTTDADVEYLGNDGKHVWYTSSEISPAEKHLFRIAIKMPKSVKGVDQIRIGKAERLTFEEGWHDIALSPDCRHYVDSWSSLCVPGVTELCTSDGKPIKNLHTAEDPTLDYAYTEIILGTVKSADGLYDNHYRLIRPKDFDPTKKYPVRLRWSAAS